MPMYAYACKDCGHAFDIQQAFSDDSLTVCPECEGTLRKKFNSVGVVFKGSGFYRNDSRAASTGSDPGAASAPASDSAKDSSGTSPAKKSPETSSPTPAPATTSSSGSSTTS